MELVAGSYEQVLFGFTVHREPATSGDREVRYREPRDAGDGPGGGLVPPGQTLTLIAGSPWIINGGLPSVGIGRVHASIPSSVEAEAGGS